MSLPPIILASSSPRRRELLRKVATEFEVVASDIPELLHPQLTATELAKANAYRKARHIAGRYPRCLVLGADTLVYLETQLFGKPGDLAEARRMLGALQGKTHQVITGVCLIHLQTRRLRIFVDSTSVRFKPLALDAINRYLASIDPLDKAGAYAIQEGGDALVAELDGSFSNVGGLPVERLERELAAWAE